MSNQISCLRKTVSWLPVVGPVVSLYNTLSTEAKISQSLNENVYYHPPHRRSGAESLLAHQQPARRHRIDLLEQGVSYNGYGIASYLLTAVGIISAVALGILSAQILAPCLIGCGMGILFHAVFLSGHNQAMATERGTETCQLMLVEP
jgi:hypothetical protein